MRTGTRRGAAAALLSLVLATASASAEERFPLSIHESKRYLIGPDANPFLFHGDTAWSLIAELDEAETDHFLADRAEKGFTVLLVNLIENRFARNAPANRAGVAPFLSPPFRDPNPAYFDAADEVLAKASDHGILILLCPAYLGYGGGDQGFFRDQIAAGPEAVRAYGEFLGARFRDRENIIWLLGGDYTPPAEKRWVVTELQKGIESAGSDHLMSYHGQRDDRPAEDFPEVDWLELNHVYTRSPELYERCLTEYNRPEARPFILLESAYENEHETPASRIRAQAYLALLGGACGHIFGNNPVWHFGSSPNWMEGGTDWKGALDSQGARDMAYLAEQFEKLEWWKLVPDQNGFFLRPDREKQVFVTAATPDKSLVVTYFPKGSLAEDLTYASKPLAGTWHRLDRSESTDVQRLTRGTGLERIKIPKGASESDWLLVLRREAAL